MSGKKDEAGVSELVGALMLVLVVSSAVFGFGLFLNKQSKETQEQKAAQKAKRLELVSIPRVHPTDDLTPDGDWDQLDIVLASEHLKDTVLTGFTVNGLGVHRFELAPYDGSKVVSLDPADGDYAELRLLPRQQLTVRLMDVDGGASFFSPAAPIAKTDAIEVVLVTALGNHVERAFVPPSAVIQVKQQGGAATSFVLDGSASETMNEQGFLTRFAWTVTPAAPDPDAPGPYAYSGRLAQAPVVCDDAECGGTQQYDVTLTVTDNFGMVGTATFTLTL